MVVRVFEDMSENFGTEPAHDVADPEAGSPYRVVAPELEYPVMVT